MNLVTEINIHQKAYVCVHVCHNARPVLLVSRDGGDWCFLCGDLHPEAASSYRVVGIGHLLERDPSLAVLMDLPAEWEAERQHISSPWIRPKCKALDG
jgi:hypothetical protein